MKRAEIDIEQKYYDIANRIISAVGSNAMTNEDLDKLGGQIPGFKYSGTYASDTLPTAPGYYIVNVDKTGMPGSHWVAVYITSKTAYFFDTYGRRTKKLLPVLFERITRAGKRIKDSDLHDKQQTDYSKICGALSMAWLLIVHQYGIRKALLI